MPPETMCGQYTNRELLFLMSDDFFSGMSSVSCSSNRDNSTGSV